MSAAVLRGLAESFLERDVPARAEGVRLRIYAIALVLFLSGLLSIESMFARPALIDIIGVFEVLAAVGLLLRNKTGLRLAVVLTILAGIASTAALTGLPNVLLLNSLTAAFHDDTLVSMIAFVEIAAFVVVAISALISWWRLEADLRAFGRRIAVPFRIVAVIGAFESVAGNALRIVGVQVFPFGAVDVAHLAISPFAAGLIAIATLPQFVFVIWSYVVLRGNAAREYFGSAR